MKHFFGVFQIAGMIGTLLTLSSLYYYKNFLRRGRRTKLRIIAFFALALTISLLLVYPYGSRIDRFFNPLP